MKAYVSHQGKNYSVSNNCAQNLRILVTKLIITKLFKKFESLGRVLGTSRRGDEGVSEPEGQGYFQNKVHRINCIGITET